MSLTVALRDDMLDAIDGVAVFASLHSADPGDDGGDQVGDREPITWSDASNGSKVSAAAVTFTVPADGHVAYGGLWDAETGGNFLGGGPLSAAEDFAAEGTYVLDTVTITLT